MQNDRNSSEKVKYDLKFSVIILAYQVEKYLEECLNSVLAQTYGNYEIVLVNPPSQDETDAICARYEAEHDCVHRLVIENRGQLLNRIAGFQAAEGDYLLCLDGDDTWEPALLEEVYGEYMRTGCDMVLFGLQRFNEKGIISRTEHFFPDEAFFAGEDGKQPLYRELIVGGNLNNLCSKAFSKETFLRITENFDDLAAVRVTEDWLYSFCLVLAANSVVYLDRVFYNYRRHSSSVTHIFRTSLMDDMVKVYGRAEKLMREAGLYTAENAEAYRKKIAVRMCDGVYRCSLSTVPYEEKVRLFERLKKTALYDNIREAMRACPQKKKHRIYTVLFLRGNYRSMQFLSYGTRFLRKVRSMGK